MKLRSALLLVLFLVALTILIPLLFLGYVSIPFPVQKVDSEECYCLIVETSPPEVAAISGGGLYSHSTDVTLHAPESIDVSEGFRYRFRYWDIDAVSQGLGVNPITVHMDADHTATAHYIVQYYLTMSTNYGTVTPGSGWYDAGSEVIIGAFSPSTVPGERYLWNGWTGTCDRSYTGMDKTALIVMNSPISEMASWTLQYYLIVSSPYGVPGGEGWYDNGETAFAALDVGTVDYGNGIRRIFTSWGGDAWGANYAQSDPIVMDEPKTVVANWATQYYLTLVTDPTGIAAPSGGGWHNAEAYALISADEFVDSVPGSSRYRFSGWTTSDMPEITDPASTSTTVLMDKPKTVTANYKTQYYLTVISPYGTPGGEGWYDNGTTAYATLNRSTVDHGNGTRRIFTSWGGDASGTDYAQSNPILMNEPRTAVADWKTQYLLTITADLGGTTDPSGSEWHDAGTIVSVTAIPDTDYLFRYWKLDGFEVGSDNPYYVTMDTTHTLHAVFDYSPLKIYYLIVKTNPSSVAAIDGEGLYNEGENVHLTAPVFVEVSVGTRYRFTHWDIDGTPQEADVNMISVYMDANHTATAHYILQYYLIVRTSPPEIAVIPGEGWYDESTSVPLTAPYVEGYVFTHWQVDGTVKSTLSIFVNMNKPQIATANYRCDIVVGGSTVVLEKNMIHAWASFNTFIIAALLSVSAWLKKKA